jgi:hypothetical protein
MPGDEKKNGSAWGRDVSAYRRVGVSAWEEAYRRVGGSAWPRVWLDALRRGTSINP